MDEIGKGSFGMVKEAKYNGLIVAAKTYKESSMRLEFLQEANTMTKIKNDHIVNMYGICDSTVGCYIILEYMCNGDLSKFLQNNENLTLGNKRSISLQLASGMKYLESKEIIHRDIAARNCLVGEVVGENPITKIADFGLTRPTTYIRDPKSLCPTRWCAQECMQYLNEPPRLQPFSTMTDMYSFAILLWEIYNLGALPYYYLTDYQVIEQVTTGHRMIQLDVPDNAFELMSDCWQKDPLKRPSFSSVCQRLEEFSI